MHRLTTSTRIAAVTLVAVALTAWACGHDSARSTCYDPVVPGLYVLFPPIDLTVRDARGRSQSLGAVATAYRPAHDSVRTFGTDSLRLRAGAPAAGTYTVRVSKPFYVDAVLTNVVVPAGTCGPGSVAKSVTLNLAPGAPPVRSVAVLGADYLTAPGDHRTLVAWVDADPRVGTAALWRLSDTTLATIDANGVVTARCSLAGGADTVTALAAADTTVRGKAVMFVQKQTACS